MTEKDTTNPEAALESWKEIAAHLKRDVRTVKRWEKSEGLPVRRHLHQARSSVYAFPSELDAWWAARSPSTAAEAAPAGPGTRLAARLALAAALLRAVFTLGDRPPSLARAAGQRTGPTLTEIFNEKLAVEINSNARLSPDGKLLAASDSGHLEVVDVATEKRTRVLEGDWNQPKAGFAEAPVWSPDGARIAYAWFVNEHWELRVIPAAGGQPQVLFSREKENFFPNDWSPDGKQILGWLRRADGKISLATVSTSGETTELRTWEKAPATAARFSPEGRHVAYGVSLGGSNQIFLLNLETKAEIALTSPPVNDRLPLWSSDGRWLLFVSDRSGRPDLWALPLRDGRPAGEARLVYSDLGEARAICGWESEGRLVFNRGVTFGQLFTVKVDPSSGATLAPPERPVVQFEGKHQMAVWSPDGKRLALLTQVRGGPLYVVSTGSGEIREFNTRELGFTRIAGWLPSNDALAMSATPDGPTFGLYLFRLAGGAPETLYSDRQTNWATVQLSPDGAAFAAVAGDTLRIVDLKRKQAIRELKLQPGEDYNGFAWAPNGRAVYAALGQRIIRIPMPSGEPQEILKQQARSLAVSPDGRTLALTRFVPDSKPRYQLYVLSSSGGEPKRVQLPEGHRPWRVRWAADGKIGYISFQPKQQFLRLSNFLPKTD